MLRVCRSFSTKKTQKIILSNKTTKLVDNFFEKNDKNGKIREALKYGEDEIKKQLKKNEKLKKIN
tara:strand:- start:251 stop:445 length:195 start_codon:yes stop_codon:yes gene_type:complete